MGQQNFPTNSMLTRIILHPTLVTGVHPLSRDRTSLVLPMVEEEEDHRLSGSNKDKTFLLHGLTPIRSRISQAGDLVALCSSRGWGPKMVPMDVPWVVVMARVVVSSKTIEGSSHPKHSPSWGPMTLLQNHPVAPRVALRAWHFKGALGPMLLRAWHIIRARVKVAHKVALRVWAFKGAQGPMPLRVSCSGEDRDPQCSLTSGVQPLSRVH